MLLHQQLDRLSRKLRQIEQKESANHLSAAKLSVLRMVHEMNPVTLKELALKQKVALPTVSKIVDELQKRALVIRAISKEDARQRWIVPTQKGLKALNKAEQEIAEFWQKKLKSLTEKQKQQISSSLERLLENLE
jgi:DNA-binding MarR family transcriptional regulator